MHALNSHWAVTAFGAVVFNRTAMNTSAPDTPLHDFSNCHVGILSKLDDLSALPALLDAAARARKTAQEALDFFRHAVFEHHVEEEEQLFPAVASSAVAGDERQRVEALAYRLAAEHRDLETQWKRLEPGLKSVAKGQDTALDTQALGQFAALYTAHARFEEAEYLPLAHRILSRHAHHMDALSLALHVRHAPQVVGYI